MYAQEAGKYRGLILGILISLTFKGGQNYHVKKNHAKKSFKGRQAIKDVGEKGQRA